MDTCSCRYLVAKWRETMDGLSQEIRLHRSGGRNRLLMIFHGAQAVTSERTERARESDVGGLEQSSRCSYGDGRNDRSDRFTCHRHRRRTSSHRRRDGGPYVRRTEWVSFKRDNNVISVRRYRLTTVQLLDRHQERIISSRLHDESDIVAKIKFMLQRWQFLCYRARFIRLQILRSYVASLRQCKPGHIS